MPRYELQTAILIISLLFNAALLIVLFTPLVEVLCKPLSLDETPQKSEVIVILAMDAFDTPNGFLDLSTFGRLQKGLELYKKGYAKKIICVGGDLLKASQKTFAQLMKETLVLWGVPEEDIAVQDEMAGTWKFYPNLMRIFENFPFDFNRSIIIASSPHTYRWKKTFVKKDIHPIIVSSEEYILKPYNWHARFESFWALINEYLAWIKFYRARWI